MQSRRRYAFIILIVLVSLIASACGGGDDNEQDTGPTSPPLPTVTSAFGITPTATTGSGPTQLPSPSGPTPTRFAGFPTVVVAPTIPSTYPNQMQIASPLAGAEIAGNVTIFGSASHPDFIQYALEYGPDPNPSGLWYPITPQAVTVPVLNNALGAWNTTLVNDGNYQLRLHVYLTGGREVTGIVIAGLQVRNNQAPPPPPTNSDPSISPIAPLNLQRGTSATIALGIFDPDGDNITFIATSDNTGVARVSPNGQAITVSAQNAGVATIRIRVADNRGGTAETSFLTTVVNPPDPNLPPSIESIPGQTLTQGATINVPVTITDPDGDTVDFTIASASQAIAGVAKGNDNQSINIAGFSPGSTTITVTATDSRGGSSSSVFSVVVNPPAPSNNPPVVGTIPGQSIEEGETKQIVLSISDPDSGDTTSYVAASSDTGVVGVSDLGSNTIQISGVSAGSASVTVTVSDSAGATVSTIFSVSVTTPPPPNQNPTIDVISNQSVEVGDSIEVDLVMSDPDGDSLTFSSTSANTNIATTGQVDTDTLSVTGVTEGTTTITVSVGDGNGGSVTTTFDVEVTPATIPNTPPVLDAINSQQVEAGQSTLVNINYSDTDGDTLTVLASSDDPTVAAVFQSSDFELTLNGVAEGSAQVTVDVDDGRGGTATQTFLVTVTAPNQNPVIDAISAQSCAVGDTLNLTANYSDPDGDPVSATPSSDNAGIASAAVVNSDLTVSCIAEGFATITITVEDDRGGVAGTSFGVTVGAANQPPTIDAISPLNLVVGDSQTVAINYSDPNGDPVTVAPTSDNTGVATVTQSNTFELTVNGVSEGTANITVSVDDGNGGTNSASFVVTVNAPAPVNQPPVIDPIAPIAIDAGTSQIVAINYSDPDGDPVTVTPTSDNTGVATVTQSNTFELTVNGVSEGTANITVSVDDGNGGTNSASFVVTVNAPAPVNQPPVIDPIAPIAIDAGTSQIVSINYSDPDGDPVTVTPTSDNAGIATVSLSNTFELTVNGVSEGTANITVSVDDGNGGTNSASFVVTVNAPAPVNQPPVIDPIAPIAIDAGTSQIVAINYSDPDGDPVTVTPTSDNAGVATVSLSNTFELTVNGVSEGTANITVSVDDGNGGTNSAAFAVTVNAPAPVNQPPVIDPIAPIAIDAGTSQIVAINYSDPDGDPVTVTPTSDNEGVVTVSHVPNTFELTVNGINPGTANITVTVSDTSGASNSTAFTVTVNTVAPPFDILAYPEFPDFNTLAPMLNPVFSDGVNNLGKLPTSFSIAGDDSLTGENFMDPISGGNYDLGSNNNLNSLLNYYNFSFKSVAVGTGWNPNTLLNPAAADAGTCNAGETPLDCELRVNSPTVIFVSFRPSSISGMAIGDFQSQLEAIVDVTLNAGTIPILVTLPNDGTDPAVLDQYNQVIVNVATQHSAHPDLDVPLWNLYITMQDATSGVYAASPTGAADYSDPALVYGVNRRGLRALQILDAFSNTFK